MEQGRVAREPVVLTHKNEKWPTRRTTETQISETPPAVPGEVKQTSQKGPWGRHWVFHTFTQSPDSPSSSVLPEFHSVLTPSSSQLLLGPSLLPSIFPPVFLSDDFIP